VGTVFEGQDKLKLVTHCRDRDSYEQNVLEEFLAYRIYNVLTEVSFQVQLVRITYVDSSEHDDPLTRLGFLIEDEDAMALRVDGTMLEVAAAPAEQFQQHQAGLMYVFQYSIGNTDWSMTHFHNVKVMRVGMDYLPIPYDFDFSGLVDAPYAGPNQAIAHLLDNVRQRLFWGRCNPAIDYSVIFAHFIEHQETILGLARTQPWLDERNRRAATEYLEEFFSTLANERRADRSIVKACRRQGLP
jgi:hypothetical protein